MPQDIPLEASDVLVFTPDCFKEIDGAPSFSLRAVDSRAERFLRRLYREEGVKRHDMRAIRAEILVGLANLWTPEAYAEHSPQLREYWDASDQHADMVAELRKEEPKIAEGDPRLKFEYDQDLEGAIADLVGRVTESWAPLRRMFADNADYGEMSMQLLAAVVIKSWTGLATKRALDRGFVTIPCIDSVIDDLASIERKHGIAPGNAWAELAIECARRLKLDEEEAGNSESPSPSSENPQPSNEKKAKVSSGKSPASASSPAIPATA